MNQEQQHQSLRDLVAETQQDFNNARQALANIAPNATAGHQTRLRDASRDAQDAYTRAMETLRVFEAQQHQARLNQANLRLARCPTDMPHFRQPGKTDNMDDALAFIYECYSKLRREGTEIWRWSIAINAQLNLDDRNYMQDNTDPLILENALYVDPATPNSAPIPLTRAPRIMKLFFWLTLSLQPMWMIIVIRCSLKLNKKWSARYWITTIGFSPSTLFWALQTMI